MKLPPEVLRSFRQFGRAGGRTRAARLAPEAKASIARKASTARWVRHRFGSSSFEALGFPGGALADSGLADLADGKVTIGSLLVSLAAPRLRREGVPLGPVLADAEERLYDLLDRAAGGLAHARYTAYFRQASSFADACRSARLARRRAS